MIKVFETLCLVPVGVFNEMDKVPLMYQCTACQCWQCSVKPVATHALCQGTKAVETGDMLGVMA